MKFDLVFSNPPYNGNVDIKILNEIIDVADEFVVVHPSTWVIDIKGKSKLYQDFKKKLDRKVSSIELFNGNPVFNIGLFVPCMITHINNKQDIDCAVKFFNDSYYVENLSQVNKFGIEWNKLVKPFYKVIKSHIENFKSIWDYNVKDLTPNYFNCQFAAIRGNVNLSAKSNSAEITQDDFYTLCMKDSEKNKGIRQPDLHRKNNPTPTFEFQTEFELNNFLEYCKTDFARFCLALYKDGQNLSGGGAMEMIPWLDFTEEWDDDKLFEKFNVSQELQDYIREFLPDFHGIRK